MAARANFDIEGFGLAVGPSRFQDSGIAWRSVGISLLIKSAEIRLERERQRVRRLKKRAPFGIQTALGQNIRIRPGLSQLGQFLYRGLFLNRGLLWITGLSA